MHPPEKCDFTRREFLLTGSAAVAVTAMMPPRAHGQPAPAGADPQWSTKVTFTVNGKACELELDNRTTLLDALKAGGQGEMALQEMFWGAYWGTLTDRFGVKWMFNCAAK